MNHVYHEAARLEDYICPAFTVKDGQILELNHAACYIGLTPQMSVASLLRTPEDYALFTGGCLYLSLSVGSTDYSAAVHKEDGHDLFLLEHELEQQLWTFSLVSQQMRGPLSEVMTAAERILQQLPEGSSELSANMRRSMNQLHRMACNMSDAARYSCETPIHQSTIDMAAVINEVMEKVCTLAQQQGVNIHYEPLNRIVDSLADAEKLERAVFNLMSNALKATPAGSSIQVSLTLSKNRLLFRVQDGGTGMSEDILSTAFSRYRRKPTLSGTGQGLGLGLVIVRAVALTHGGTVLLEHPKGEGTRVTLSLAIRKDAAPRLGSPLPAIDYAGGRDHALLELSDALPAKAYKCD